MNCENIFEKLVELTKVVEANRQRKKQLENAETDEDVKEYEKAVFAYLKSVDERSVVFKNYIKLIGIKYTDKDATKKCWDSVYSKLSND